MDDVFEWSDDKAATNEDKHKVTFGEATGVFRDALSRTIPDPEHSDEEERFVTIGMGSAGRLVVVVHTERGDKIRIISARNPTPYERKKYENE